MLYGHISSLRSENHIIRYASALVHKKPVYMYSYTKKEYVDIFLENKINIRVILFNLIAIAELYA